MQCHTRSCYMSALLLLSCSGVKFSQVPLTTEVPAHFLTRNLYADESGLMRYKLPQLVGSVLHVPTTGSTSLAKVVLREGYTPKLEVIPEAEGKIVSLFVDQGASLSGSYLSFAASLSQEEVARVTICDRNLVHIANSDIPWELLRREAKNRPSSFTGRRLWVRGALLSSVDGSRFTKINADASAVLGETLGAKGNVYNRQGSELHDYRISMDVLDLDALSTHVADIHPSTPPPSLFPQSLSIPSIR